MNTTAYSFDYSPHRPHQWEAAQSVAVALVAKAASGSQVALETCLQCVVVFISAAEALLSTGLLHPLFALSFHMGVLKLL